MNYNFPTITNIDDVHPYIKEAPEFIVVEKENYNIINYVVMNEDTFPSVDYVPFRHNAMIRRECRGLIFDRNGILINRRFHKFFNVNEREETSIGKIDWTRPHVILEKLDGSMVSPCYVNGHVRWMTKMGITDTSMEAEVFVASRPDYTELAAHYLQSGFTPIFEWCSNKNRIVLDYPEDRLVLTAMRETETGNYLLQDALERIGERYGIEVVKAWSHEQIQKMGSIIGIIRDAEGIEGVVVRFDDGHMVKIKSDWYVRIHKAKAMLTNEREVVSMILNNQLDDLIPVLPKEDIEKINVFQNKMDVHLKACAKKMFEDIYYSRKWFDRKTFAIQEAQKYSPLWRSMIFKFWDQHVNESLTYQAIVDIIMKHSLSNQSYRAVKTEFLAGVDYV